MFNDHITTPTVPLTPSGLLDLATALVDFEDRRRSILTARDVHVAQLLAEGEAINADPRALVLARRQLVARNRSDLLSAVDREATP